MWWRRLGWRSAVLALAGSAACSRAPLGEWSSGGEGGEDGATIGSGGGAGRPGRSRAGGPRIPATGVDAGSGGRNTGAGGVSVGGGGRTDAGAPDAAADANVGVDAGRTDAGADAAAPDAGPTCGEGPLCAPEYVLDCPESGECTCRAPCPPLQARCGGACVDLEASDQHCGRCGQACGPGTACRAGRCAAPACTGPLWTPGPPISAVRVTRDAVLVDFDGDGRLDLAGTGWGETAAGEVLHGIDVARGEPDGTFRPVRTFLTNRMPLSRAIAADVDRDGRLDVVASGSEESWWLRNAGDLDFVVPASLGPWNVLAAGEIGAADLGVVARDAARTVLATVSPAGVLTVVRVLTDREQSACAFGDLVGDGATDLVCFETARGAIGSLRIWTGTPGDVVPVPRALPTEMRSAVDLLVTDLDDDARPELLAAGGGPLEAYLEPDSGDGGRRVVLATGSPFRVAAGDVDADGRADLVIGRDDGVAVHRSLGAGQFEPVFGHRRPVTWVAAADVDGDGRSDVLGAHTWPYFLQVFRSQSSDPPFTVPDEYPEWGAAALDVGDVDGDGAPDVVTVSRDGELAVAAPGARGRLVVALRSEVPFIGPAKLVDFDLDGRLDLVVVSSAGELAVLAGDGGGGFSEMTRAPVQRGGANDVDAGDLDGDGFPDLVATSSGAGVYVHYGCGRALAPAVRLSDSAGGRVQVIDLDVDGRGDVLFAGAGWPGTSGAVVSRGRGDFVPVDIDGTGWVEARAGDLNGDRRPDVVACTEESCSVWWNDGDLRFRQEPLPPSALLGQLAIEDLDGDGDRDVIAADWWTGMLPVLLNDGTGSLAAAPSIAPPYENNSSVRVTDLDRDGRVDLVTTSGRAPLVVHRTACAP